MFSHTLVARIFNHNLYDRHPSESLNNPLICRRFLKRQTDGRKQESEARTNKPIEQAQTIRSANVPHEQTSRRAQKGTLTD